MGTPPDPLADLADVPSVLLLGPSVDPSMDEGCKYLLAEGDPDRMLAVSFTLPPVEWIDQWVERVGDTPEELVVVGTSDAFNQPGEEGDLPAGVDVEYLSSPGDLTGIGMVISRYLERWHDNGREMAVCFDSLTTLLQYSDARSVYRFLHLITTRLSGADARAHFHLDPGTQDDRTVSTVASTFQAVARYTDDGWETRRR